MDQRLLHLALALAAGELVHNIIESQEVRKKVKWLRLSLAGKPYIDKIPFRIDTRLKSYAISLLGLLLITAIFYGVFDYFNFTTGTALKIIIILLVLAYVVTAYLLDKYHVEIAAITPTKPIVKK